jgi:hypothetical protein
MGRSTDNDPMVRRWGVFGAVSALVVIGCAAPGSPGLGHAAPAPGGGAADVGTCPMFPADSYWHKDVSALPVSSSSPAWTASIGTSSHVHADFGSGLWDGGPIGIPWTSVGAGQPQVPVTFDYADESDPGPYPIPSDAPIEGGAASDGDRHVLVVDTSTCRLYETWDSHPAAGAWHVGSGATWDLRSDALRPAGWTSADAAGLPILPGLVRYEEVAAGHIDHAIRFTAPRTQTSFIWPARHEAGSSSSASLPPMGAWFRLRADYDTSHLTGAALVIAQAMKKYGIILADNGSSWYISGSPDDRWNNDNLHQLDAIAGADFQAVDTSGLAVSPNSGQTR